MYQPSDSQLILGESPLLGAESSWHTGFMKFIFQFAIVFGGFFRLASAETYTTYNNGKIVNVEEKAKPKYKQSTRNSDVLYIKSTGFLLEKTKDEGLSPFETLEQGCSKGRALLCTILGDYFDDKGDIAQAVLQYDRACLLDLGRSCLIAGSHYLHRLKNYSKAVTNFDRACQAGDELGCFNKGHALRAVGKDKESEARVAFDLACKKGFQKACIELGYTFKEEGLKNKDNASLEAALKIFAPYCGEKDPISCTQAGELATHLNRSAEAKKLLTVGCKAGEESACELLNSH